MESAVESFRQGKVQDALQSLVAAEQENSQLPPAKVMLARMFFATGNGPQAKLVMEEAAVASPDNPDVFLLFAAIAMAEGRISDALLNFERSKHLADAAGTGDKLATEATLGIASVFELRGQWDQADTHLRAAIKSGADDPAVLVRLARTHFALKNYENTEKLLRRAFEQDPSAEPAEIVLGQWFHVDGQPDAAERWLRLALEKYPSDQRVLMAATLWAIESDRYDQAKTFVERLTSLAADDPNIVRMQGIVARFGGDYTTAENAFQQLATENPGDFAAANQLALVLLEHDQPEKQRRAVQLAQSNYRQYPQSVDARATLGWAYFRQGLLDDAEAAFRPIVPPERLGGDSAYYAAMFHHQRGRSDVAQTLLAGALAGRGAFTQRRAAIELLEDLKSKAATDPATD